jgi:sensor histidine kinase YesM
MYVLFSLFPLFILKNEALYYYIVVHYSRGSLYVLCLCAVDFLCVYFLLLPQRSLNSEGKKNQGTQYTVKEISNGKRQNKHDQTEKIEQNNCILLAPTQSRSVKKLTENNFFNFPPNVRQAMRVNHEQARMNESQGRRADLRGTKATYSLLLTRCDILSLTGSLC